MSDFSAAAHALDPDRLPLEQLMNRIVFTVLPAAQRNTPVRTGNLRRSETAVVEAAGKRGIVGTNVSYAPMVHSRVPFFELGAEDAADQVAQYLLEAGLAFLGGVRSAVS